MTILDFARRDQRHGIKLQHLRGLQETQHPPMAIRVEPPDRKEDVFAWCCVAVGAVVLLAVIFWL